ncbi:MAG: response regulator [Chloroflexi bacterium]|nr:response regulator [Chloroflexota bacterium]
MSDSLTERAWLANLRHELRTPINAIIGYSEMLLEDAADRGDERLSADLQKIQTAGSQLLARVNEILDPARIETEGLGADRETFGANLRHELRTPLSAVIGYTEMLLEEQGGQEEMRGDLEKIHAAAERFLAFINDIVHVSTAEPGEVPQSAESAAMVADVVRTIQPVESEGIAANPIECGVLLVVDDNEINRDVLSRRLERQGHRVETGANGQQALDMVRAKPYDLILLDLMMPEMNGYQVLQHLKADALLRDIPVIMISALDEVDTVVRCIEMGAEDYMPKPFNPVLLKARIGACLEKKRLRDRQRELFGKFATKEVAEELLRYGFSLGGKMVEATAMFSDIRSFTTITESQTPAATIEMLNRYFSYMVDAIGEEGGIVNQIVGDGLMAIFGAPLPRVDHRARATRAALKMCERIEQFNREQAAMNLPPIRIGIGIAAGEVIAGYTGTEARATYTCVGDTVNLAARLESHTKVVGQPILINEMARLGLDDTFQVEERGTVQLKGKTQAIPVYSVSAT